MTKLDQHVDILIGKIHNSGRVTCKLEIIQQNRCAECRKINLCTFNSTARSVGVNLRIILVQ